MLKDHNEELHRVAEALLEMETLDAEQFEAIYTGAKTAAELQAEDAEKNKTRKAVEDAEAKERAEREAAQAEAAFNEEGPGMGKNVLVMDRNGRVTLTSRDKIRRVPGGAATSASEPEQVPGDAPEDTEEAINNEDGPKEG